MFVTHYDDFYGAKYPIWLAIEVITFSQLSKLFRNLKNQDKSNIAKEHYQIPYSFIQNWLRVLSQLRNVCAHYGRLYNKKLVVKLLLDTKAAKLVSNDKIFGVVFVLNKLTINKNKWLSFKIKLEALVEEYNESIELERIGFPTKLERFIEITHEKGPILMGPFDVDAVPMQDFYSFENSSWVTR